VSQLSDVDIGSETSINTNSASAAAVSRQDASSVTTAVVDNDDDEDDDDDDNAFTHSSALTIKSSHHSPSSSFGNVDSSSCGHVAQSSLPPNSAKDFEPSVTSYSNNDNNSRLNAVNERRSQRCTAVPDVGGPTCATNADSDLRSFLSELGLGKYADVFYEQDVDLPMFLTLNEDDLKEIGIRLHPL